MSVEMARTTVGRMTIECCVRWCVTRCAGSDTDGRFLGPPCSWCENSSAYLWPLQVELSHIVEHLHRQRHSLIQTQSQYTFCYRALLTALQSVLTHHLCWSITRGEGRSWIMGFHPSWCLHFFSSICTQGGPKSKSLPNYYHINLAKAWKWDYSMKENSCKIISWY